MMETPFTYYRGAALPMASDLATTPATGMIVQACGDAHLSNFGLFGSPERKLVFDVNDFDETLPAPWEWDVKRLAASLEVAARENGFSDKDRRKIALAAPARYRQEMRQLAGLTNLDVWYTQVDIQDFRARWDNLLKERQRKTVDKGLAKARTRDSMQELQKLTRIEDGQPRIISEPPVIIPIRDLLGELAEGTNIATELRGLVGKYRRTLQPDRRVLLEQYEVADLARKVVGVGSVGTRCWIVLMLGRDDSDPLFLQIKEAEESVLARFAGASSAMAPNAFGIGQMAHETFLRMADSTANGQHVRLGGWNEILAWNRESDGVTLPTDVATGSPSVQMESVVPMTDAWSCVEFHLSETAGTIDTWVDGNEVPDLVEDGMQGSQATQTWQNPMWKPMFTDFGLGWESYDNETATLWFDDVIIDKQRIGCAL